MKFSTKHAMVHLQFESTYIKDEKRMIEENSEKKGFVYILINPAFTGFVKVGKTIKEPEVRARELSSGSGVPAPYAVAWDALVTDCGQVEKLIHQQLAHVRSRNDRG